MESELGSIDGAVVMSVVRPDGVHRYRIYRDGQLVADVETLAEVLTTTGVADHTGPR